LLEKGENPTMLSNDFDRATPLHFSVLADNLENVKLLLKKKSNPNARDSMGNTPMHFAVSINNLPMVKLLDDFGADATIKNMEEECAIDLAQKESFKDLVSHFMSQGKYKNFKFSQLV
jgi:serine/threonine-protein phosphatase 6 regulatory ankyrin repeat subunit A/serine/threonine-protein phosphatase 6 regulatory ankyrin repeat subunit B/cytohesin